MKTFINAAKRSKFFSKDEDFTPIERKWVNRSLTKIILGYKIEGNIEMFNHMMYLHN